MAPHEVDFAFAACYVTGVAKPLTLAKANVTRAGEHTTLSSPETGISLSLRPR